MPAFPFALVFNLFQHDITNLWIVDILFIMRLCRHLKIFCWCLRVFSFLFFCALLRVLLEAKAILTSLYLLWDIEIKSAHTYRREGRTNRRKKSGREEEESFGLFLFTIADGRNSLAHTSLTALPSKPWLENSSDGLINRSRKHWKGRYNLFEKTAVYCSGWQKSTISSWIGASHDVIKVWSKIWLCWFPHSCMWRNSL